MSTSPAPTSNATRSTMPTQSGSGGDARAQLLAGAPALERRMTLAGIETSVLEGGQGADIVLLHGPGEFAGKWLRVLPALTATHHVVAPDLPAHGASGLTDEGPLDAARIIRWLDDLIGHTCSQRPVLVGHVLGGAIAARFAVERGGRLARLVLVDSLGLARFRPSPKFALAMAGFQAAKSERSYNRFMRQCSYDLDALREEMAERWDPFVAYNLEGIRGPNSKAVGQVMRRVGLPRIPADDLAGIRITTDLIWGRHDRANRLRIAEDASASYGWPLHVIEECADDPARDRPEAFLDALRVILDS